MTDPNPKKPVCTQTTPPAIHVQIAKAMSDGRERTLDDLSHKISTTSKAAIKCGLDQMIKRGLIIGQFINDTRIYRRAAQ